MTSILVGDLLLRAWEEGAGRQGEALLECLLGVAYDVPATSWSDQPLGVREAALLELYDPGRSRVLATLAECPSCSTVVDVSLDLDELVDPYRSASPATSWFDVAVPSGNVRVRHPSATDIWAAAAARDVDRAREVLLSRCIDPEGLGPERFEQVVTAAAHALEQRDPLSDVRVQVVCGECEHSWETRLDVGVLVWAQVRQRARALLTEVDGLARRYGWSEPEILAMSPRRRQTYLELP